tara:strand:- start:97 stop:423 length:327 start_codon:yes stop_codon:yes gene_type:complete
VGGARGVGNGLAGQGQGRPEPASLFLLRALGTLFAVGGAFARNLRCQLGRRATPSSVAVLGFGHCPSLSPLRLFVSPINSLTSGKTTNHERVAKLPIAAKILWEQFKM